MIKINDSLYVNENKLIFSSFEEIEIIKLLKYVILCSGNILTRQVMETCSLNFVNLSDKMSVNIILQAIELLKKISPETYYENLDIYNYILLGNIKEKLK